MLQSPRPASVSVPRVPPAPPFSGRQLSWARSRGALEEVGAGRPGGAGDGGLAWPCAAWGVCPGARPLTDDGSEEE